MSPRTLAAACVLSPLLIASSARAMAGDIAWVWYASDAPSGFREISVLTESLIFSGEGIEVKRRQRPLHLEPGTKVTPVIHVHQASGRSARLGPRHADAIEQALRGASRRSTSEWVQLDFEAFDNQQAFYVELLKRLRASLPATIKLSVTVRASWCDRPALLDSLAADEVVPMFFRMGEAASGYRERLVAEHRSLATRCRDGAVGLALQEPMPMAVSERYSRRYWFNYRNWDDYQGRTNESTFGIF